MYELLLLNITRYEPDRSYIHEYLGGHIIASFVAKYYFKAKVCSCSVNECSEIITKEITQHEVNLLGFYVAADNVIPSGHVMRWVKQNFPSVKILVGGPEAYALGEKFMHDTGCDYIVCGEGEYPVLGLLNYEVDGVGSLASIRGIKYFDSHGKFTANPPAELIHDLDSLPFPDRRDSINHSFRSGKSIGILTGRGCPFHCAFCFEGAASKTVRFRSIQNVIAEIEDVRSWNSSLKCVNVYDDTFTLNESRVRNFCEYMKSVGLFWTCEAHVSILYHNPEMIDMMANSGLIAVQIGIESGSPEILRAYSKNTTPEMILDVVAKCKSAGLYRVEGNYILGGAFETEETISRSIEHAKQLITAGRGITEINTVFFAPYYGTPITRNPENFGIKIDSFRHEHTAVTMAEAVTETERMTANDIVRSKERFEREITEHYILEAGRTSRDELLHGTCRGLPLSMNNSHWLKAWTNYPHIESFMRHLSADEQEFSPTKYPVRSAGAYIVEGDSVSGYGFRISGDEAKLFLLSDGRMTVQEIAEQTHISPAVFMSLNDKCLVYFSAF